MIVGVLRYGLVCDGALVVGLVVEEETAGTEDIGGFESGLDFRALVLGELLDVRLVAAGAVVDARLEHLGVVVLVVLRTLPVVVLGGLAVLLLLTYGLLLEPVRSTWVGSWKLLREVRGHRGF